MVNNDFMLAKNSGSPPDKLLLDKSLAIVRRLRSRHWLCVNFENNLLVIRYVLLVKNEIEVMLQYSR